MSAGEKFVAIIALVSTVTCFAAATSVQEKKDVALAGVFYTMTILSVATLLTIMLWR